MVCKTRRLVPKTNHSMNIIYVSLFGNLDDNKTGGGLKIMTWETAKKMASRGHQILIVCPGKTNAEIKALKNLTILEVESIDNKGINMPIVNKNNEKFLFEKVNKFKPHIVHAQDISPCGIWLEKWANLNTVPFVITLHMMPSDILDFGINDYLPLLKLDSEKDNQSVTAKFLYDEYFKNAQAVIALNKAIKNDLLKYVDDTKISIIPNGIEVADYSEVPVSTGRTLLFTGQLAKRKNQSYLLSVQLHLNNTKLYLVGSSFSKQYENSLKKRIAKEQIPGIEFVPAVPHSQIKEYMAKAKVFVSASLKEVQSISVIEALASGKPIVCLANETTSELVDDTVGKVLPQNTPAHIFAQEVEKILALSMSDYKIMANNCQKRVRHLNWPNVLNQLEKFYIKQSKHSPIKSKKHTYNNLLVYTVATAIVLGITWTVKNVFDISGTRDKK
jgi:glycosyltransferase involved in cell wall biosynthesis